MLAESLVGAKQVVRNPNYRADAPFRTDSDAAEQVHLTAPDRILSVHKSRSEIVT